MTKTAYAHQLSAEEFAERAKDLSPEEREEFRIENATSPLFDMWLRFKDVFGDRAIDRLDISDEDAEAAAKGMEGHGPAGDAFVYLLRTIPSRRHLRGILHMANAVWEASGTREPLGLHEIHALYAKLPKGEA
jgi:hypothetical protein